MFKSFYISIISYITKKYIRHLIWASFVFTSQQQTEDKHQFRNWIQYICTSNTNHRKFPCETRKVIHVRADQAYYIFIFSIFYFQLIETSELKKVSLKTSKSLIRRGMRVARKMRLLADARGQKNNSIGRYDTLRHAPDGFPDRAVIWRRGASAARRVQVNGKNPV